MCTGCVQRRGGPRGFSKVVDDRTLALTELVTVPGYKAKLERIFRVRLEAFDWNCPQHITPRFTEDEVTEAVRPLRDRVKALQAEVDALRARP